MHDMRWFFFPSLPTGFSLKPGLDQLELHDDKEHLRFGRYFNRSLDQARFVWHPPKAWLSRWDNLQMPNQCTHEQQFSTALEKGLPKCIAVFRCLCRISWLWHLEMVSIKAWTTWTSACNKKLRTDLFALNASLIGLAACTWRTYLTFDTMIVEHV